MNPISNVLINKQQQNQTKTKSNKPQKSTKNNSKTKQKHNKTLRQFVQDINKIQIK